MVFEKEVVFLGGKTESRNGKTYSNVNLEADDEVLTIGALDGSFDGLQKYKPCRALLEYRIWNGNGFLRFMGVRQNG